MTRKQAKAVLPVITAFASGKEVQYRDDRDPKWRESDSLSFDSAVHEYRIKPVQQEFWIVASRNGRLSVVLESKYLKKLSNASKVIHVKEVISE